MNKEKSVTFIGRISGDMECFCWDDVPIVQRAGLVKTHTFDLDNGERLDRMYPNDVFDHLGCKDKRYRFTISVEEIKE